MWWRRLKCVARRLRLNPTIWSRRVDKRSTPLDSNWLRAHPLPDPANDVDKNERGRVLVIGGSKLVPGGIALTAEAALRAGAGKVQVATVNSAALLLGMTLPEIAVIALDETTDGELIASSNLSNLLASCDAVVAGPAMSNVEAARALVEVLVAAANSSKSPPVMVLDASALLALPQFADRLRKLACPLILTPHLGELAALLECDSSEARCPSAVSRAASRFGATVVSKGPTSFVATADGEHFAYPGGGVGLATSGSGDVLAGLVGGLAARGAPAVEALLWSIWLHGEAGRRCAEKIGPLGYLARELLAEVPLLMRGV
ncbi:MAG: NAD(P)H-hydrate dehydratase [Sphingomonadaceae bacterium]|nr:NAD(P)H-hydrate dehydratase [Sphingomonadaceae bacterium]